MGCLGNRRGNRGKFSRSGRPSPQPRSAPGLPSILEDDHRRGRGVGVGVARDRTPALGFLSLDPSLTAFSPRCLTLVVVRCRSPLAVDCSRFAPLSLFARKTPLRVGFSARANKGNLHGDPDENGQPPPAGNLAKTGVESWNFPGRNFGEILRKIYFFLCSACFLRVLPCHEPP